MPKREDSARPCKHPRKALELAAQQNKQALAESIKAKISLYEAGTPFREPQHNSADGLR